MNKNLGIIAGAAVLVTGVATAAYMSGRSSMEPVQGGAATVPVAAFVQGDDAAPQPAALPATPRLEYAAVTNVAPITEKRKLYAQVIGSNAIRESSTSNSPREVCNDVAVQERLPERDGNIGGTVVGAVVGGLVGNQVGRGNGRKLATVAGAVGGGFAGREIDRRHVGGRVVSRTERQCHTVNDRSSSSQVVGYDVTFRNPDGSTGTMRTDKKPGNQIDLGSEEATVGYDVTYSYQGQPHTVRMDERPAGDRLPVMDGQVMTQLASTHADEGSRTNAVTRY